MPIVSPATRVDVAPDCACLPKPLYVSQLGLYLVPAAEDKPQRRSRTDGVLCAALLGLCLLATWPVAEMGINDDWSYTRTAQVLAQTHHLVYNGWATAMLGWQVYWGALFAWLFGSGFTSIRLSTVPIALATAILFHAILRRFGLNRGHAIFGTLTLVLGPLFLPLSDTFMSDVPGLFAILVCIYLCQRAITAEDEDRAVFWLAGAAISNVFLGSVRQIAWLGVLVMVPSCAYLLRRRRLVLPVTVITWLIAVVSIRLVVAWFNRQPYAIPESLLPKAVSTLAIAHLFKQLWRGVMTTLLFSMPALATALAALWPPRRSQVLRSAAALLILAALYGILLWNGRADLLLFPWLGNIVTPHGIMQDIPMFGSDRAVSLKWLLLLMAAFTVSLLASVDTLCFARHSSQSLPTQGFEQTLSWRTMSVLLLPFLASYCVLLLPRAAFVILFDRYLLEIIAILLIYLLRWHQERVSQAIPAIAIIVLTVVALLGVAATHDLFAIDRAEVRVAEELQRAGIPRTRIRGGFDFDSITQVEAMGYINDPHILNPPNAYRAPRPQTGVQDPACIYPFSIYLPALDPEYVISADPKPCLAPAPFAPVSYRTWLPWARRQLFVATVRPGTAVVPPPALSPK